MGEPTDIGSPIAQFIKNIREQVVAGLGDWELKAPMELELSTIIEKEAKGGLQISVLNLGAKVNKGEIQKIKIVVGNKDEVSEAEKSAKIAVAKAKAKMAKEAPFAEEVQNSNQRMIKMQVKFVPEDIKELPHDKIMTYVDDLWTLAGLSNEAEFSFDYFTTKEEGEYSLNFLFSRKTKIFPHVEEGVLLRVWYTDLQKGFVSNGQLDIEKAKQVIKAFILGEDWKNLADLIEEKDDDSVPIFKVSFKEEQCKNKQNENEKLYPKDLTAH